MTQSNSKNRYYLSPGQIGICCGTDVRSKTVGELGELFKYKIEEVDALNVER